MIFFEIPGAPPLLLNSRLHWKAKNKMKKDWERWVHLAVLAQRPPVPFEKAAIHYVRCCGHVEPDYDNLVSGWKWIQDALVRCLVLSEDRRNNIEPHYDWVSTSRKDKRIQVRIQPILQGTSLLQAPPLQKEEEEPDQL